MKPTGKQASPEFQMVLKAIKLLEAATEAHSDTSIDDHKWRECRRCLAIEELYTTTGRVLLTVALAALKAVRDE